MGCFAVFCSCIPGIMGGNCTGGMFFAASAEGGCARGMFGGCISRGSPAGRNIPGIGGLAAEVEGLAVVPAEGAEAGVAAGVAPGTAGGLIPAALGRNGGISVFGIIGNPPEAAGGIPGIMGGIPVRAGFIIGI